MWCLLTLQIFLYGGYSKEVSSDKTGSEKGIVHSDLWSLDPRTWEWNKVLLLHHCFLLLQYINSVVVYNAYTEKAIIISLGEIWGWCIWNWVLGFRFRYFLL